jgi:hypothetical protein
MGGRFVIETRPKLRQIVIENPRTALSPMDSPAALATAVLDRLEDDLPSVRAWLAELARHPDQTPAVAALVAGLEADLNRVIRGATALATACGKPA